MALDREAIAHIAKLARIRVPEAELDALAGELSTIISWVEQLDEVDTDSVDPMTSVVAQRLKQRPDKVTDGGYPEKILANAPDSIAAYFAVPKVME